jgi:hypothetical protein
LYWTNPDFEVYDNVGRTAEQIDSFNTGQPTWDDMLRWTEAAAGEFAAQVGHPDTGLHIANWTSALSRADKMSEFFAVSNAVLGDHPNAALTTLSKFMDAAAVWCAFHNQPDLRRAAPRRYPSATRGARAEAGRRSPSGAGRGCAGRSAVRDRCCGTATWIPRAGRWPRDRSVARRAGGSGRPGAPGSRRGGARHGARQGRLGLDLVGVGAAGEGRLVPGVGMAAADSGGGTGETPPVSTNTPAFGVPCSRSVRR